VYALPSYKDSAG